MAGHRFHNRVGCVFSGGTIFIAYEIHLGGAARFSTRKNLWSTLGAHTHAPGMESSSAEVQIVTAS